MHSLLTVDTTNPKHLTSRENSRLEYKRTFNWNNRARYAKTLAAFANNDGGFIVFGVEDSPRDLVGIGEGRFDDIDPATITEYLQSAFVPILEWDIFAVTISGTRLGVMYAAQANTRPVLCIKNDGNVLREAEIYYRYRGRSDRIRYSELEELLRERQERERKAWLHHLSKVARLGVENVGLLDMNDGELSGRGGRLLMSGDLLEKVQFIRKGRFAESKEAGSPTLRLIGDVEVVTPESITPTQVVSKPVLIGEKEIMLSFLRQEKPQEPEQYIRQACRESSLYMPIYYFANLSGLNTDELRDMIMEESSTPSRLTERIDGKRVVPQGSITADTPYSRKRISIVSALSENNVETLGDQQRIRVFEAITHFTPSDTPSALFHYLANLIEKEFNTMLSNERTLCRKAISYLDEFLNLPVQGRQ